MVLKSKIKKNNSHPFSHLEKDKCLPKMVDISTKLVSERNAIAFSSLRLPLKVVKALKLSKKSVNNEIYGPKGPVFQTAIIAGTMAVKKTFDLIPFCHPLLIHKCQFKINFNENKQCLIEIYCEVRCQGKTGVEMEALVGASMAALTIYDMCKALSKDIVIEKVRLLEKSGGKSDYSLKSKSKSMRGKKNG